MRLLFITLLLLSFSIAAAAERLEDPALQQIAIESYVRLHDVSAEEAARRLRVQDRAAGIDDRLEALLGADYAGAWFNHDARGRLEIGITRAGRARSAAVQRLVDEYALGEDAALVEVRFSLAELKGRKASIRESLMDLLRIGHVATAYDPRINSVILMTLAELPPSEEARIRELANQDGVVLRRVDASTLSGQNHEIDYVPPCRINGCNRPLRGGRGLGNCTAGFIARHRVNTNDVLVLTAGHCVDSNFGITWRAQTGMGTFKDIGPSYGFVLGGLSGADAGAILVDPSGFWGTPTAPEPWVVVQSSAQTTYNSKYEINDDGTSMVGQTLCYSGMVTLTNCAQVWMLGLDFVGEWGDILLDAGGLWPCTSTFGDSGAPIYKVNRGRGLLLGAMDYGNGSCLTLYQGIRAAEDLMNVDILEAP